MKIENTICDECGVVKGASNHWMSAGVFVSDVVKQPYAVVMGDIARSGAEPHEIHDLCGEQCFHKHIARLLRMNPPAEIPEAREEANG